MDEVTTPKQGTVLTEEQAMGLAISQGKLGAGFVSPNPLVGCAVLDSKNQFLASGYHHLYGGPHAEVDALEKLKADKLSGAKMFVTLEPCAHEGQTPSCAKRLARLPLSEVIFGVIDPNPLVAGKGAKIISDAGIGVRQFKSLHQELEELAEHFFLNFREKKVFVSGKIAASIDGQVGLKNGESKWITGESSRQYARFLRGCHDAVVVGKNTILIDDPKLDFRNTHFEGKKFPTIFVFDQKGECLKQDQQLFKIHSSKNIFLVVDQKLEAHILGQNQTSGSRVGIIGVNFASYAESIADFLHQAWTRGIRSVFVEGGPKLLSEFLSCSKVDRMYLFQGPVILGSKSGLSWTPDLDILSFNKSIKINGLTVKKIQDDVMITGRIGT